MATVVRTRQEKIAVTNKTINQKIFVLDGWTEEKMVLACIEAV